MFRRSLNPLGGLSYSKCLFFRQTRRVSFHFVFAIVVCAGAALTQPANAQDIVGCASVIDGDTIEIHGTRIRLFAIDAVEASQTCTTLQGQRWPCGREAAFALADHLAGKTVNCRPLDTDRYGRIVAQCYIEDQDIAAWSVANGWAMARASYSIEYMGVQRRAVSSHRGILSGSFDDPQSFRKAQ